MTLVSGRTVQEHLLHLDEVLSKLRQFNLAPLCISLGRQFQMAGKLPAGIHTVES